MPSAPKGETFRSTVVNDNFDWPSPSGHSVVLDTKSLAWQDSFAGSPNPSWKYLVRKGLPATTPASGVKYSVSWPYVSAVFETHIGSAATSNLRKRYQSYIGPPCRWLPSTLSSFPNVDTNSLNQVTARVNSLFLDRAKSAISSFQSGQDLVELHQTIESIIHPMKSLREHVTTYFTNLKKIRGKVLRQRGSSASKSASLHKALSDTYLEWTFGWNPLTSDIAAGITDLTHMRPEYTIVSAKANVRYSSSDGVYPVNGTTAYIAGHQVVTSDYTIKLKGMVSSWYNGTPPTLLQELQLLPEDFAPTAWNVLPYSFVIDYFLNIGDIINAYSFPTAALRWCNKTSRQVNRCVISYYQDSDRIKSDWTNLGWIIDQKEISSAHFDATVTAFQRQQVSASSLIPPLVFEIPPLSSKPWLNIAALIGGSKRLVTPFY